jgi:hypothetical protein
VKEDPANMGRYINADLTQLYNLDLSIKERPVMNVDDVFLVLHHHWVMDTANFPDGRQTITGCFPGTDDRIHGESTRRVSIRGTQ